MYPGSGPEGQTKQETSIHAMDEGGRESYQPSAHLPCTAGFMLTWADGTNGVLYGTALAKSKWRIYSPLATET